LGGEIGPRHPPGIVNLGGVHCDLGIGDSPSLRGSVGAGMSELAYRNAKDLTGVSMAEVPTLRSSDIWLP